MAQPLPPQPLLPEAGHCCAAVIGDIDDDYRVGGLDRGVVFASPPVCGLFLSQISDCAADAINHATLLVT